MLSFLIGVFWLGQDFGYKIPSSKITPVVQLGQHSFLESANSPAVHPLKVTKKRNSVYTLQRFSLPVHFLQSCLGPLAAGDCPPKER